MTKSQTALLESELRDARVLITGASGFLGRHLCRALRARGAQVHGAALRSAAPDVELESWQCGDLADAGVALGLISRVRPDLVFHLASLVKGARDRQWVAPMLEANLVATVRLLDAIAESAPDSEPVRRVVLCGSLEEPGPEHSPASPYAASKGAAAIYGRLFADLYGLPIVHAKIFMVYGPGAQDERKLVPYVIRELLAGRSPKLSSGQRAVDWIDVRDVAEGLIALATAPASVGRRLDLGSGELIEVREVVSRLFGILEVNAEPDLGSLPDRPNEVTERADVATTEAVAGFRPKIGLDQGLRDTVAWFRGESS